MFFTTEGFFVESIESWREWDLDPQPLNSVEIFEPLEPSGHEFNFQLEPSWYSYSNFIGCSVSHFISSFFFFSRHVHFN